MLQCFCSKRNKKSDHQHFSWFLTQSYLLCCWLVTARKRSLGQGNMFTGVCLSTVGCLVPGGLVPVGGCLAETPRGRPLLRAVRILLECILVKSKIIHLYDICEVKLKRQNLWFMIMRWCDVMASYRLAMRQSVMLTSRRHFWWLVRATLVVDSGFLPQNFGRLWGPMNL